MNIEEAMREQSERHHAAIGQISVVLAKVQERGDQTYQLLAGSFERPGLVHRMAAMESWRTESPKRWIWERMTKLVDGIILAAVATILYLGLQASLLKLIRTGETYPYQRDRVALTQEQHP